MYIFKENKKTGLACGVNDYGMLFCGDKESGYCIKDTAENRELVRADFDYYNRRTV